MQLPYRVLEVLADGRWHSSDDIARALGVERAEALRALRALADYGFEARATPGQGYRLADSIELLDRGCILAELDGAVRASLAALELVPVVDSTNRYLADRVREGLVAPGLAVLAECQTRGRGRRGRAWASPPGNVYLSLYWRFPTTPPALAALGMAAAVMAAEALAPLGAEIGLKWPNDLVCDGRKLGGVLVDMTRQGGGALDAVIGIGLNVHMPAVAEAGTIEQPWTDLSAAIGEAPSRSRVAGRLLGALIEGLARFQETGFADFRAGWERRDVVRDKAVRLEGDGSAALEGLARGVDASGALLLEVDEGRVERVVSGELSLRAVA